jgi:predicted  nucleic acid-binding Zn-ribbon protein
MKEIMKNLFELQTLVFEAINPRDAERGMAALRAKIPAPILAHYDRLTDKGKKGVALLRNQACGACHMQVSRAGIIDLIHGTDICVCGNCGRYLYLPEDKRQLLVSDLVHK